MNKNCVMIEHIHESYTSSITWMMLCMCYKVVFSTVGCFTPEGFFLSCCILSQSRNKGKRWRWTDPTERCLHMAYEKASYLLLQERQKSLLLTGVQMFHLFSSLLGRARRHPIWSVIYPKTFLWVRRSPQKLFAHFSGVCWYLRCLCVGF